MCINETVSFGTFTVCTLSCIYLFKRNNMNDRWISILFAYLGTMQLLEYLMWRDQECNGLNQIDLTDLNLVKNFIKKVNPNILIHCAALTDVEKAEKEPNFALNNNCYSICRPSK